MGPRAALIRNAVGFIKPSSRSLTRWRVSLESSAWTLMKSLSRSRSSSSAHSACSSASMTSRANGSWASTRMSKPSARRATA
jgi:hypothetical protein